MERTLTSDSLGSHATNPALSILLIYQLYTNRGNHCDTPGMLCHRVVPEETEGYRLSSYNTPGL